ncbi:hypothetical protein TNCV_4504841 [Trichonephila clavipes]|nr:hypothetical protein TNCV_4504841 [Trichonephila clavipes]
MPGTLYQHDSINERKNYGVELRASVIYLKRMFSFRGFSVSLSVLCLISSTHGYDQLESIANSLLSDVMSRMGGPEAALAHPGLDSFDDYPNISPNSGPSQVLGSKDYPERSFEARRDAILGRESIRDQEYLEENSLYGKLSMQETQPRKMRNQYAVVGCSNKKQTLENKREFGEATRRRKIKFARKKE